MSQVVETPAEQMPEQMPGRVPTEVAGVEASSIAVLVAQPTSVREAPKNGKAFGKAAKKKEKASSSIPGNDHASAKVDEHINAKTSSTLRGHHLHHDFNTAASALEKLSASATSMARLQEREGVKDREHGEDAQENWDDGFFKMPPKAKPDIVDGPKRVPQSLEQTVNSGVHAHLSRLKDKIASLEEKLAEAREDVQSTGMVSRATAGEMKAFKIDFETKIAFLSSELGEYKKKEQFAAENIESLTLSVQTLQEQNSNLEIQCAGYAAKLAGQEAILSAYKDRDQRRDEDIHALKTKFGEQETFVQDLHRSVKKCDERYAIVAEGLAVVRADVSQSHARLKDERNQIASGIVELLREETISSSRIFESQLLRTVATIKELKSSLESNIAELWEQAKHGKSERARLAREVEKQQEH